MISLDAQGIHLFNVFYIRFYALILMTGMALGAVMAARRAKSHGLNDQYVWDALLWIIIPGVIGARLYHVFTPSPAAMAPDGSGPLTTQWYFAHPWEILFIWHGGLGIYGGVLGGLLGVIAYARKVKEPLLPWLDIAAPSLAVAQGIGRWGNFVNFELYGAPSTLPWAIYIPPNFRLPGYMQYATYHPLFLYESLWNFAAAGVMILLARRFRDRLLPGDLALIYLMEYPIIRFLLDFLRLDSNDFGPLTTAQLVSLGVFLLAAAVFIIRHIRARQNPKNVVVSGQA